MKSLCGADSDLFKHSVYRHNITRAEVNDARIMGGTPPQKNFNEIFWKHTFKGWANTLNGCKVQKNR